MGQSAWKFPDPPNVAVFTTTRVIKDDEPVLYVAHDAEDGAWQFHAGAESGSGALAEVMVVSLKSMIERDQSLIELADLPLGWTAERSSSGAPWTRSDTQQILHLNWPRSDEEL
jgi:hypothetical protein